MRFLADMGVSARVVEWLRSEGHDLSHLRERGLHRLSDRRVFELAAAESRVVITFDLDFGEVAAHAAGQRVGVILIRLHDTTSSAVIDRLGKVLRDSGRDLEHGAVVVVEETRHRVRRWPGTVT